ncbi:Nicotinate phosphoribosyltransferase 2, partial [Striga hermonthica]
MNIELQYVNHEFDVEWRTTPHLTNPLDDCLLSLSLLLGELSQANLQGTTAPPISNQAAMDLTAYYAPSAHHSYYQPPPPPPGTAHLTPPTASQPVNVSPPYAAYVPSIYPPSLQEQVRTLFVAGLPEDVKPREIYNLFRECPGYQSSNLRPPTASNNQPFAFATFVDQQSAVMALHALNGLVFDLEKGSTLYIDLAKSNSRSKRARTDEGSQGSEKRLKGSSEFSRSDDPGFGSFHTPGMANSAHNTIGCPSTQSFWNDGGSANKASTKSNGIPCPTLFVANLGPTCSEEELMQAFSRCRGFLKLKMQSTYGTPVAFVDFKDTACSTEALSHLQGAILYSSTSGEGMRLEYAKSRMGMRMFGFADSRFSDRKLKSAGFSLKMDKNLQMAPSSAANGTKKSEKLAAGGVDRPTNPMVTPLLTDLYQFTMAYAYWKAGKHNDLAVFDLYFRRNPFGGEYTVFAGLEECIKLIANFRFTEDEIAFIKSSLPSSCEDGFYDYLRAVDCSNVEIHAISEGYVVFPKIPLMRIEGPVAVVQLLETPLVNLINYASLVATNAARHRFVAGKSKLLLEFGLRRAQGPDGGISASKYCYMGGFDATSNCAAGKLFGIPLRGTHSHAFVSSFTSPDEIAEKSLKSCDSSMSCEDFVSLVRTWLSRLKRSAVLGGIFSETNQSELAAFVSYALAFPKNFLALVDTYDVMRSGVPNFCAVALALNDLGYKAAGVRLDSGDLAYLSCETRRFFQAIEKEFRLLGFGKTSITASNDLNEVTLDALKKQGHEIDVFGIGTHLVTCYAQPALGVVFKLVEINNQPRIKLSEDVSKVSIPCKKRCYRLYGKEGYSLVDLMTGENEPPPK